MRCLFNSLSCALIAGILLLVAGCGNSAYHPPYIISHQEKDAITPDPSEELNPCKSAYSTP